MIAALTAALQFVSDFADQAVVLPSALAVCLALLVTRRWRNAVLWLFVVGVSFGTILALKLVCRACGSPLPDRLLLSPSGHTMAATVLYGGLIVLAGVPTRRAVPAAAAVALLIGGTRLALRFHTLPEVLVGAAVGLAAVACFSRLADRPPAMIPATHASPARWLPIALALLPVLLLHGQRSHVESAIHRLAVRYVGEWLGCTRSETAAMPGPPQPAAYTPTRIRTASISPPSPPAAAAR